MITHVVLVQPKPETSPEELQTVLEQAKDLQQIIPGIKQAQIGKNIAQHHQGYAYGLIMQFEDQASLQNYYPHPAHQAVAREIVKISANIIELDMAQ